MSEAVERCVEDFLEIMSNDVYQSSSVFVESFVDYLKEIVEEKVEEKDIEKFKTFERLLRGKIEATDELFHNIYDTFLLRAKRDAVKDILCEAMLEISPNLVLPKLNRFVHPARWQKCRSGVCVGGLFAANNTGPHPANTGPHPAGCGRRLLQMGLSLKR